MNLRDLIPDLCYNVQTKLLSKVSEQRGMKSTSDLMVLVGLALPRL